ncbi:MAG: hypothetical protein K5989_01450 [Lachnospiraceae bacterium]|nr:hypothetical protein [Lachnospiraceae bacterium]
MDGYYFNFTGIYKEMIFPGKYGLSFVELSDISGTAMYVDAEAEAVIRDRLLHVPMRAVHFLDNGNYHYVTRLLLEKAEEPLDLLIFDHHRDNQPSAFLGMRSCGSWILDAEENLSPRLASWKLVLSDEERDGRGSFDKERPLYISIDKDVLSPEIAPTNWDQGNMTLSGLISCLREEMAGRRIAGVDICGEWAPEGSLLFDREKMARNDVVNAELWKFFAEVRDPCIGTD